MRAHDAPAIGLAKLHRINGLRDSTNLVHLQEQRVARLVIDGFLHPRDIRDGEVITDNLGGAPDLGREGRPCPPVVLVEGILDGDQRVVGTKVCVEVGQLSPSHLQVRRLLSLRVPGAKVIAVATSHLAGRNHVSRDLELGRSHIHANLALVLVAGLLDGLHDQLNPLLCVTGRRETALISNQGGIAAELFLDDSLQRVVAL
mmetsp:Transcript_53138/g.123861  ORF Transcript_53138/g.123861 Transcript_53138/m.123861 type:complete len:202 (+) Transcript_53138:433-1038(+)